MVPGLPGNGGEFYVIDKGTPALPLDLPASSKFDAAKGFVVCGSSAAKSVHYAMVMPGAVLGQGVIPVVNGRFSFTFDPVAVNATTPSYQLINRDNGKAELANVVHLTFFAEESGGSHAFARLIVRGNTIVNTR